MHGVLVIEGDRPGSSHYAGELSTPSEEANARARGLRLHVEFVPGD